MTRIDRRRLVQSLTAAIACTGLPPSLARSEVAVPNERRLRLKEWWTMIRRHDPLRIPNAEGSTVDFWSREYSEIDYGDHLPPEIQRTSLFYESCDRNYFNNERALSYLDAIPERFGISPPLGETLNWSVCWDTNYLPGSYLSIAGSPSSPKKLRTGLFAIDSNGRSPSEPEWAEMLPDFRRTYERIVGLCYLPQGDPGRTKAHLDTVLRAAYHCDAVIVTSRTLAETDPGLAPATLVGELVRRLGHALLERKFLDRIPSGTKRKPRFFALGGDMRSSQRLNLIAL
jgi:hypothetical protein